MQTKKKLFSFSFGAIDYHDNHAWYCSYCIANGIQLEQIISGNVCLNPTLFWCRCLVDKLKNLSKQLHVSKEKIFVSVVSTLCSTHNIYIFYLFYCQ